MTRYFRLRNFRTFSLFATHTFVVCAVILLAGCATPPTIKDAKEVTADSSVVFGSVEVYVDGEKEDWGMKFTGHNYFYLMLLPPDKNQTITYRLADDGVFYWALPPGEYLLLGYLWQDLQTQRSSRIGATFVVPEPGSDAYLGSIEFHGNELFMIPRIKDRFDVIADLYKLEFPGRQADMTKQMLQLPLPLGNFSSVLGPCHDSWGIECGDRFSGVTPVSPKVTQSGFPEIGSHSPEFRWEPSPKPNVSYDFVLYEAAAYAVSGALVPSYMKGRVAAYAENLKEPRWQSDTPLAPDARYLWSVRFRDDQTVSGWSTQGHFSFMIVAMSSGFGQWFQFKTP